LIIALVQIGEDDAIGVGIEELDAIATVGEMVHTVVHSYTDKTVELFFYRCDLLGEPKPMMGQDMKWVARSELASLPFPDADLDLIKLLSASR